MPGWSFPRIARPLSAPKSKARNDVPGAGSCIVFEALEIALCAFLCNMSKIPVFEKSRDGTRGQRPLGPPHSDRRTHIRLKRILQQRLGADQGTFPLGFG